MLELAAFWFLVSARVLNAKTRAAYFMKTPADWLLDLSGLVVQGAVIPLLQVGVVAAGLAVAFPAYRGTLELPGHPWFVGFLLNFIVVDYLYYWNHRLLHQRRFWPLHQVHHSLTQMDVLGTSRNTLWSSFLLIYLWVNGVLIYVLHEPGGFMAGAALTASLDLWRHSALGPTRNSRWERWLGSILILPNDHAAHHGDCSGFGNYGANLCIWDRLHATFLQRGAPLSRLGVPNQLTLLQQLLWPFS